MNKFTWHWFLAKKSRTGRTHYKFRKVCTGCEKPICDNNRSGYCQKCRYLEDILPKHQKRTQQAESNKHLELKDIAQKFLEKMGCADIATERQIGSNGFGSKSARLDVSGILNGRIIAVECGSMAKLGLRRSWLYAGKLAKLYVLPYGEREPFEYQLGMELCSSCGHKV
ncbi:hypothetical protein LCGC14_2282750 [marine sediment metagenome]|uniref:Uncharacterized protein n=1 Tax=marine sediment metagenome TaxID=412755 RepID=A0A0F9CTF2_9ZZZZ